MEEIKVNDFVKLDDGTIGKYQINKNWINVVETNNKYIGFDIEKDVVKHSSNIKDLVQAGDIIIYTINCKIADIDIVKEHTDARTLEKSLRVGLWSLEQVNIKQILTKERFESESYRLEE